MLRKHDIDSIVNELEQVQYKMAVNILGGEPTLHPLLSYVVERLSSINNVVIISITTNGMKPVHSISNKLRITYSVHPSQDNIKDILRCTKECKVDSNIVIMEHDKLSEDDLNIIKSIGIPFKNALLNLNGNVDWNSNLLVNLDSNPITLKKLHELTDMNFYGWTCIQSYYRIQNNRAVSCQHCCSIKNMQPITTICAKNTCVNDCYIAMMKWK